jgi:hypothetical protein
VRRRVRPVFNTWIFFLSLLEVEGAGVGDVGYSCAVNCIEGERRGCEETVPNEAWLICRVPVTTALAILPIVCAWLMTYFPCEATGRLEFATSYQIDFR